MHVRKVILKPDARPTRFLLVVIAAAGLAIAAARDSRRSISLAPTVFERSVTRTFAVATALAGLTCGLVAVAAQLRASRSSVALTPVAAEFRPFDPQSDRHVTQIRFLRTLRPGGRFGP